MSDHRQHVAPPMMAQHDHGSDGALDRMLRLGQKQKGVPAIFIHAGAGFHSHQNEHVHLEACVAYVAPIVLWFSSTAVYARRIHLANTSLQGCRNGYEVLESRRDCNRSCRGIPASPRG
jgi:hypothetical protein